MKRVTILGVTGSVGRCAVDVVLRHKDRFSVAAITAHRDVEGLAQLARQLQAQFAILGDETLGPALRDALAGSNISSGAGRSALLEAAAYECDFVVAAISGAAGLEPTYASLVEDRVLALANKESLVCAGQVMMARAKVARVPIRPVDSEHNALAQALKAGRIEDAEKLILTASGGPFRTWQADQIAGARAADALRHPTWSMGDKITVDSATLMNKGLELIEAHHLFGVAHDRLDVLVHPQSIIHGLVQWCDGSVTSGMAVPDMRIPIAESLSDEARLFIPSQRPDWSSISALTFEKPDENRFPCLRIARAALKANGAVPTILNAANEVAVSFFMKNRLPFNGIASLVEKVCEHLSHQWTSAPASIDEALFIDSEARRFAHLEL
jgi:1-deoxy-D-xylulose-5-phosphate reductoisomerase